MNILESTIMLDLVSYHVMYVREKWEKGKHSFYLCNLIVQGLQPDAEYDNKGENQ